MEKSVVGQTLGCYPRGEHTLAELEVLPKSNEICSIFAREHNAVAYRVTANEPVTCGTTDMVNALLAECEALPK